MESNYVECYFCKRLINIKEEKDIKYLVDKSGKPIWGGIICKECSKIKEERKN